MNLNKNILPLKDDSDGIKAVRADGANVQTVLENNGANVQNTLKNDGANVQIETKIVAGADGTIPWSSGECIRRNGCEFDNYGWVKNVLFSNID